MRLNQARRHPPHWHTRDEQGTALVELTWLGLLLLLPLVWVVTAVFAVQQGAFATAGAARSAARAFSLADDDSQGRARARAAAVRVMVDQGIESADPDVTVTCVPSGNCHLPGTMITVRVKSRVDLPLFPRLFGEQHTSFALDSNHTVPIGRYRDFG